MVKLGDKFAYLHDLIDKLDREYYLLVDIECEVLEFLVFLGSVDDFEESVDLLFAGHVLELELE